jgi:hypothetical protein
MRTTIIVFGSLLLSLVTLAPAASASPCQPATECPQWVCDQLGNACDPQPPHPNPRVITPYAHDNPDGSYTVGLRTCDTDNYCTDNDIYTTKPLGTVDSVTPYARSNPNGSTTVGYTICDANQVCTDHDLETVGPVPGTCIPYNPDALTNVCLTLGSTTTNVPIVTVGSHTQTVCPVGTICENVPVPDVGLGTLPVTTPTPVGFVEATVLCGLPTPCRVTL